MPDTTCRTWTWADWNEL